MTDRTVAHSTFVIERNYPAAPQQVFRALSDPARKRRWFAEGEGFEVDSFEMDFRVGGFERSRFRFKPGTPVPAGTACANDTVFLDIINNERIVVAYTMTVGGNRMSVLAVDLRVGGRWHRHKAGLHRAGSVLRQCGRTADARAGLARVARAAREGAGALVHAQTVDVNRVFHALSDATRRQMIERLSEGPVSARSWPSRWAFPWRRWSNICSCWKSAPWSAARRSAEPACAAWNRRVCAPWRSGSPTGALPGSASLTAWATCWPRMPRSPDALTRC